MSSDPSRRTIVAGAAVLAAAVAARATMADPTVSPAMKAVLDYAREQQTTGFLVIQNRQTLAEKNWPAPADNAQFSNFTYGTTSDGELLEDVASQQKSFVSMLVETAIDKGLIDITKPVSDYIGAGWSKASPEQEAQIQVIHVLHMASGLTTDFAYAAPPGGVFLYNTPVYAITKRIVAAAAKQPLETLTHDWLTGPAGMSNTSWRQRPAIFADVGNPTGLVTTPRDTAKMGQVILDKGLTADGTRIVSEAGIAAMFVRSPANPSYGRLWWLNGGAYTIKPLDTHVDGPLIPSAPADLVAALGALDRKLYVAPSKQLVVVRMGPACPDKDFDEQLWRLLTPAIA